MTGSHDFESVECFTVGAVGDPGQRVFLFQARAGEVQVSVKCEKQQVAALTEYLQGVLADLPPVDDLATVDLEVREPIDFGWVAGTLSVAYDDVIDRIVILVEEVGVLDEDDDEVPGPDRASLRVRLTRVQVAALVRHSVGLVDAGRPPCPVCGNPRGPDHACPRTNGHGPPS